MSRKRRIRPAQRSRVQPLLETLGERICPSGLPPVAVADSYAIHQGTTLNVTSPGLLGNDTDPEQDQLTAEIYSYPSFGYLILNENGSFDYVPDGGYVGTDSFQYQAFDGSSFSNIATVTIDVTNQAPVANPDDYTLQQDGSLFINAPGILGNDTDGDNDSLTAELFSGPNSGYLFLNSDGSFEYYPGEGFTGTDSFQYWVFDSAEYSTPATVTLVVEASTRTVTWDGGGDGIYWHDPMNWDIDQVPGAFDDVNIYTTPVPVIHISGDTTLNSLHSDADLDWTGSLTLSAASTITGAFDLDGTLNLQDGVTLDLSGGGSASGTIQLAANSEFLLSGGGVFDVLNDLRIMGQGQIIIGNNQIVNLSGDSITDVIVLGGGVLQGTGTLTVTNQFTWTGGTITGTGTIHIDNGNNPASLIMSGAQTKTLNGRTLEIASTATADLTGGQLLLTNATIDNYGVFSLEGNNVGIANVGNSSIVNSGIFQKDLSQDTDVSEVASRFVNFGGAVFGNTGLLYFTGLYEQFMPGTVLSITSKVRAANMELSAGTVEGEGTLWIGGGVIPDELRISNTINMDQISLKNEGTVRWLGGNIRLSNGASIWNEPDAEFRIESHADIEDLTADCVLYNFGTLRKIQLGLGGTNIFAAIEHQSVPNQAGALIEVMGGILALRRSGNLAAPVEIAVNSNLVFAGTSEMYLKQGTNFFGAGVVGVTWEGSITIDQGSTVGVWAELWIGNTAFSRGYISGAGTLETWGQVRWFAGHLTDLNLFVNKGVMRIESNFLVLINSSTLRNEGTINWISETIQMDNDANPAHIAQIHNYGVFNLTDSDISPRDPDQASKGEFRNELTGEVRGKAGPGTTIIEIPFINYGSITLSATAGAGDLTFTDFLNTTREISPLGPTP